VYGTTKLFFTFYDVTVVSDESLVETIATEQPCVLSGYSSDNQPCLLPCESTEDLSLWSLEFARSAIIEASGGTPLCERHPILSLSEGL